MLCLVVWCVDFVGVCFSVFCDLRLLARLFVFVFGYGCVGFGCFVFACFYFGLV